MSAVAEPADYPSGRFDWDTIFTEVNAWRGSCLHHFTKAEMAVTETLFALSSTSTRFGSIRLRQLIGQRFEDLMVAIGPEGGLPDVGHEAFIALSNYRANQEAFRALLCHGAIKVTVDPSGHWTLVIRSLSVRARHAERGLAVIEKSEAQTRLASLKRDGQKLTSTLGHLRKAMEI